MKVMLRSCTKESGVQYATVAGTYLILMLSVISLGLGLHFPTILVRLEC